MRIANQKQTRSKKTILMWSATALLLLAVILGGVLLYGNRHQVANESDTSTIPPATPEEKQDSDQKKQDIVDSQENPPPTTPPEGYKKVNPIIVSAAVVGTQVEVRSYVAGVLEDGGECKATFTQGSQSFVRLSEGSADATTTTCAKISVNKSDFPATGKWQVIVSYSSATAKGDSDAMEVTVP